MSDSWKPQDYPSLSPYLIVSGAQEVVSFAQKAFDATVLRRYDRPDGTLMHAELRIDDSIVMIADATSNWPGTANHLHLYVRDALKSYRRALAAGGVSVMEPIRKDGDPDRRGGVKDPAGNTWWIATQEG